MMFALVALLCATVASAQSWKPVAPDSKQPTQTEIDEAKRRYQKGIQLYEVEGDVTTSLLELQRAYDLAPNFAVLYNIGQVARTGRDYLISLRAFEAYLQFGGAQVPADKRTTAENEIKALKELVGTIKVTTNVTTGTVFIDEVEVGKLPLEATRVNPGSHRVRVDSDGKQSTKTITIAGGETQTVDLQIDLSVKPPPPDLPPPPNKPIAEPKTSYAWVGWLVTGVLAAGAIGTGSVALVQNADVNDTPYTGATVPEDLDSKRSTVTALAVTTDVLIGAAVLTAGISLYFTIRDSKSDEAPEAATSTALRVSPNGLTVVGSF
jgi:hypothetical protein